MATPNEFEEIIKGLRVMINGFIRKRILPCSELDILRGKLPPEKNLMFQSVGIDLIVAITCFPLDPFIPLVKMESKDEILETTFTNAPIIEDLPLKNESLEDYDDIYDDPVDFDCDEKHDIKDDEPDSNKDQIQKSESDMNDCDDNTLKRKPKPSDDDEGDYMPPAKVARKEKVKIVKKSLKKKKAKKLTEKPRKVFPRKDCQECAKLANNQTKLHFHCKDAHSFDMVRGIMSTNGKFNYYLSHDKLLEKKEALKNHFDIRIPPPEFTKENFESCNIPELINKCLLTDMSTRYKKNKTNGNFICVACHSEFKSINEHKEHYLKYHRMQFKCPKESCNHNKKMPQMPLVDFARHFYFHSHPLPQLKYPHQCLDCNYENPFMCNVEHHVENSGPFHNNKCPKCDVRYSTRQEKLEHMKLTNHNCSRCGFCNENFDDINKLTGHKPHCKGRKKGEVCPICGKETNRMKRHMDACHKDDPKTCEHCGEIYGNEHKLKEHFYQAHSKNANKTCETCGKIVSSKSYRSHMINNHTPDHLKPFVCHICKKGFLWKRALEAHMNGHYGLKPFKCKYCDANFADVANKRMHERCSHEGHKRK